MPLGRDDFDTFLTTLDYPVRKDELIQRATSYGFDEGEVRRALESTPVEDFNSPNSVTEAFAKLSFPGA